MNQFTLLSLVKDHSSKDIDYFFSRCDEDLLRTNLTSKNALGKNVLNLAVQRGDVTIVKQLIDTSASIGLRLLNEQVEEEAKVLADRGWNYRQIYLLLSTRAKWVQNASVDHLFCKSIKASEDALTKTALVAQKTGILFLGMTGVGKSTLINCLHGVDYEAQATIFGQKLTPLSTEIVQTGHTTLSETLYPSVTMPKGQFYVAIEVPGFGDTRGSEDEACAALSMALLAKRLRYIQALVLVTTWAELADSRMLGYRAAASQVGSILTQKVANQRHLFLVVTKGREDLTRSDVRARLENLYRDEHWSPIGNIVKQEEVTPDVWKNNCIRVVTQALLGQEQNILLVNVTSAKACDEFNRAVNLLANHRKRPSEFSFSCYSESVVRFQEVLKTHVFLYFNLLQKRNDHQLQVNALQTSITSQGKTISDRVLHLQKIKDREERLKKKLDRTSKSLLNGEWQKIKNQISTQELQMRTIQGRLVALESDVSEAEVCIGDMTLHSLDDADRFDRQVTKMLPLIRNGERLTYQMSGSRNIRGIFNQQSIRGVCEALIADLTQRIRVNLKFFQISQRSLSDENQSQIRNLHSQLASLDESLRYSQTRYWEIEDQIRQNNLLKAHVLAQLNTCAEEFSCCEVQIKKLQQEHHRLCGLCEEVERERVDSQAEIEVNLDLFLRVQKIINLMGFDDELFHRFEESIQMLQTSKNY